MSTWGPAIVAAVVAAIFAYLIRWLDIPRPFWVVVGGGAGGGPGNTGEGGFTLVNQGRTDALDVRIIGLNCRAHFHNEGQINQGMTTFLPVCPLGERLHIRAEWDFPDLSIVGIEVSWAQASVRKRPKRKTLLIRVAREGWPVPVTEEHPTRWQFRWRAFRARFEFGRPRRRGAS